ncbi:phosphoadenosine phosphosulfate reductase family protein [Brevibacterium otitidis]|uniref:Phosphoadenosine phosphosulfate reductase family protein n=1 Tax=Brevibacterium otitidis TaxID=53364 RepID=A0ABV5X272_9MICO|nr:hypothetical protein GCM10023233_04640 [Brevibacterium otitidis]
MLIHSHRHTPRDLAAWERLEAYDEAIAATGHLEPLIEHAMQVIAGFLQDGPCYVSTSWGKDSTVLVDLVAQTGADIPVVSVRVDGQEMDGTDDVRDAVLAKHPRLRYDELTLPPFPNRSWAQEHEIVERTKADVDIGWKLTERRYGPRRITGIRAEESRIRNMVLRRFGDATRDTCRPIGRWEATDVFAYLHARDLPVHPAYGMSYGGALDRRWLRVHSLGGVRNAGKGRADWEKHYYGDIIRAARLREAVMPLLPEQRQDATTTETLSASSGYPATEIEDILTATRGVVIRRMNYATRWYRTIEWPPRPTWSVSNPDRPLF